MLLKSEVVNKIKDYFDLNVYETKVWLALLSKGIASAGEVAEISGVPRSRAYDVLEGLEKKGFAIEKLGKPVKYLGVKPEVILEKLKSNLRFEVEEKISFLSNIKETPEFEKLEALYRNGIDPVKREEISAAITGRANISNYLRELLEGAKEEVIICSSAFEFYSKINLFKETIKLLKKSGVEIKIALFGEKSLIERISSELKVDVKMTTVESKFFIIDGREILFYLSDGDGSRDCAIWLNSEFFSKGFVSLFEKSIE